MFPTGVKAEPEDVVSIGQPGGPTPPLTRGSLTCPQLSGSKQVQIMRFWFCFLFLTDPARVPLLVED